MKLYSARANYIMWMYLPSRVRFLLDIVDLWQQQMNIARLGLGEFPGHRQGRHGRRLRGCHR